MMETEKKLSVNMTKLELMKAIESGLRLGANIHIYLRGHIPSWFTVSNIDSVTWEEFRIEIEEHYEWQGNNRLIWNRNLTDEKRKLEYILHLDDGITIKRDSEGYIELLFDAESNSKTVEILKNKLEQLDGNKSSHEIGFIHSGTGRLTVKFCDFKPYRNNLTSFMGEEVKRFYDRVLEQISSTNENGLYLLYGAPGTGKTSFIKQVLSRVDKKALFITPAFTEHLTSPELIGLLMDYPDSILVIEDAETVLMKREADNSSAVSNLLNLSDGFPADFLNLNIICTFNTELDKIDPALLREGRLKGMQEFTKLSLEQARKMADRLDSDVSITEPMTVAEICNGRESRHTFNSKQVGFGS